MNYTTIQLSCARGFVRGQEDVRADVGSFVTSLTVMRKTIGIRK